MKEIQELRARLEESIRLRAFLREFDHSRRAKPMPFTHFALGLMIGLALGLMGSGLLISVWGKLPI